MPASGGLTRALMRLQQVQLWIASLALVAMMLTTCTDVTLRYLFNRPVGGAYDFVEAMLVIFVFNGLSAVFLSRGNIVIDVLDARFGPRVKGFLIRLFDLISVVMLITMGWAMVRQGLQAYDYGDRKLELDIPVWILWAAGLVGMAGTVLCAASLLLDPKAAAEEPHP
jgi:TRAP-type C4-dicarboxylate transport system permease small subunit